jgi:hypothetical protein
VSPCCLSSRGRRCEYARKQISRRGTRSRLALNLARDRSMSIAQGIDPSARPSGEGCAECEATGGWWLHLRRCAQCGHIGCCDDSPSQHATGHAGETGHPIIQSFEPGENWFWNFVTESMMDGPELSPPTEHSADQPTPGPAGRVPADWRSKLH